MEGVLSATDQRSVVSSFLEIAVGQTADTARQFLKATSWNLEEAIQLFYLGNEGGTTTLSSYSPPLLDQSLRASRTGYPSHGFHTVIPFHSFNEAMKCHGVWESENGVRSTTDNSRDNLTSLYQPPFTLMFHGPFEKAKDAAKVQDRWLLVNLQSTREFSSHMLNRDTWANEAVAQIISTNFIFWQVYNHTEEGKKVSMYYKLDSAPVILLLDPIIGVKMHSWSGMIHPESLLEDLLPFMDGSPKSHRVSLSHKHPKESFQAPPPNTQYRTSQAPVAADGTNEEDELQPAMAASMEGEKDINSVFSIDTDVINAEKEEETCFADKLTYPPLPEEPKGDRNRLYGVGIRQ